MPSWEAYGSCGAPSADDGRLTVHRFRRDARRPSRLLDSQTLGRSDGPIPPLPYGRKDSLT